MENQQKTHIIIWLRNKVWKGGKQQTKTLKKRIRFHFGQSMEIYGSYRIQQKLGNGKGLFLIPVLNLAMADEGNGCSADPCLRKKIRGRQRIPDPHLPLSRTINCRNFGHYAKLGRNGSQII